MKLDKSILLLLVIAYLSVCAGCSDGTYTAEKLFWKANVRFQKLLQGKDTTKDVQKEIDALIFSFSEIILRYPNWKSVPHAHFNIARLYELKNESDKARKEYDKIYEKFSQEAAICVFALNNKAILYERENNWDMAEKIYKQINSLYPYQENTLIVPLYIAQHYMKSDKKEEAQTAFRDALAFYNQAIENSNETTVLRIGCISYAVSCLLNLEGEEKAVGYLQSLREKYPDPIIDAWTLFNIGKIYQFNLNDKALAIKYYQQIIDKYPDGDLAKKSKAEIEGLSR
ncbi:MAG: tetratricopeptide repeat protein [Candidatus Omnitrophica bacterium]|nr:tetratricopeptide repeat protein [Candidatus Omnitrophota bacterium]